MNLQDAAANADKAYQQIVAKAWEDEAFKQSLIADPVATSESFFGQSLDTKGKNVVVVDQSDPNTIYINIPQNTSDMELSEEELETVAGGGGEIVIGTTTFYCTIKWD